jgi:hypothetical protein
MSNNTIEIMFHQMEPLPITLMIVIVRLKRRIEKEKEINFQQCDKRDTTHHNKEICSGCELVEFLFITKHQKATKLFFQCAHKNVFLQVKKKQHAAFKENSFLFSLCAAADDDDDGHVDW